MDICTYPITYCANDIQTPVPAATFFHLEDGTHLYFTPTCCYTRLDSDFSLNEWYDNQGNWYYQANDGTFATNYTPAYQFQQWIWHPGPGTQGGLYENRCKVGGPYDWYCE